LSWFILFAIDLIVLFALFIIGTARYRIAKNNFDQTIIDLNNDQLIQVIFICLMTAALGIVLSITYLSLARRFPRQLIIGTTVIYLIFLGLFGIYIIAAGSIAGGVVIIALDVIFAYFFYSWRSRIPFATIMLETVTTVLQLYPASNYVAYFSLIFQLAVVIIIGWSVIVSELYSGTSVFAVIIFLLFSFYWITQVIKNVVHVTTSGSVATWYFMQSNMPSDPTIKSLKRAVTTSFGSICLGSLLIAVLQLIRSLINSGRNQRNAFCYCIVECLLGCIENLIRYFNIYAFSQVAIYGKSYCEAARDTWALFQSSGFAAIINDNLISNVLMVGCIINGVLCAFLGGIVSYQIAPDFVVICFIMGGLIGFAIAIVSIEVIHSGVATIFVCFVIDKEVLRNNNPELFHKLVQTYSM